jgi:hypothetical protein
MLAAMAIVATVLVVVLSLSAATFYSYIDKESPIDVVAISYASPPPRLEGVYARNTLL